MGTTRMLRLLDVPSQFQAHVVAARLRAEGIASELRGGSEGPYPWGEVTVMVSADDFDEAREVLLVEEVESAFARPPLEADVLSARRRRARLAMAAVAVAVVFVAARSAEAIVTTLR